MKYIPKTKEFKVKLESVDPSGRAVKSERLSMTIVDDPNSMIHERLYITIGECLYTINKRGIIIDKYEPNIINTPTVEQADINTETEYRYVKEDFKVLTIDEYNNKQNSNKKMRILTEYQKEFLFERFFRTSRYSSWKELANSLLENGKCLVAKRDPIWIGGIGNFIKIRDISDGVGVSLYTFDLENFIQSAFYKEFLQYQLSELAERQRKAIKEFDEISKLI